MTRSRTPSSLVVWMCLLCGTALLVLSGCVSTEEQFAEAESLRMQGQYEEAAYLLVRVLERDGSYPDARPTLLDVAQQANDSLMTIAQDARAADAPVEAIRYLDDIADLQAACTDVEVNLTLPDDYASFRRATERDAFQHLMDRGDDAVAARDWEAGDRAYEQAQTYARPGEERQDAREARAKAALGWAEALMNEGAYRAAHERAARVFEWLPDEHTLHRSAERLRSQSVAQGTRRVAYVPLRYTPDAEARLPNPFLSDLNDVLRYEHWTSPPLFLDTANPGATWRVLRRLDLGSAVLDRRDATLVGRDVDADYVVFGTIRHSRFDEKDVETKRRPVTFEDQDADTSYVVRTYDLTLSATVDLQVVDVRTSDVVFEDDVAETVDEEISRASYPGDTSALALSRSEQRLFDPRLADRARDRLAEALVETMSETLSGRVYDGLLDRIP